MQDEARATHESYSTLLRTHSTLKEEKATLTKRLEQAAEQLQDAKTASVKASAEVDSKSEEMSAVFKQVREYQAKCDELNAENDRTKNR